MLIIMSTPPTTSSSSKVNSITISYRDAKSFPVVGCPDLIFCTKTYQKISRNATEDNAGSIISPVGMFFETLTLSEQKMVYDLYAFSHDAIETLTESNRQDIDNAIQDKLDTVLRSLNITARLVEFCGQSRFIYPNLSEIGTAAHHTQEKSYFLRDYIDVTAIAILGKMLVPIWGSMIEKIEALGVSGTRREQIVFGLIEPSLEEGVLERIYNKMLATVHLKVKSSRDSNDKLRSGGGADTAYILTHNGVDSAMLESMVMATLIVKRLPTFDCFISRNPLMPPDIVVSMQDSIGKATDSTIAGMRTVTRTMPREPLSQGGDDEENTSIIDHMSRTSKVTIDVPVIISTSAEIHEIPRLLKATETDLVLYEKACAYYRVNGFDISPLVQAMVSAFVGDQFGGSKCLNYLTPTTYQKLVTILQIHLIKEGLIDLAALLSSKTSLGPMEIVNVSMSAGIIANLKSDEYIFCQNHFKGLVKKPVVIVGKRGGNKDLDVETIDFVNHIAKMVDWLTTYGHSENMAPVLWDSTGSSTHPIVGEPCYFNGDIVRDLCRFYISRI